MLDSEDSHPTRRWQRPGAALIGDAAHAYGPLTGKMANLAVNDAYTLGAMLNNPGAAARL